MDDELGDVAALPPPDEEPELLGDVPDLPPAEEPEVPLGEEAELLGDEPDLVPLDEESEPLLLLGEELSPALDDGALPAVPAQESALSLLPGSDPVPADGSEPALPEDPLPPLLGGGLLGWPLLGGGLPGCALG